MCKRGKTYHWKQVKNRIKLPFWKAVAERLPNTWNTLWDWIPLYIQPLYAVHSLRPCDEIPSGVNKKNKHQDPTGLTQPESGEDWQTHSKKIIIQVTETSLRLPVSKSVARASQRAKRQVWETPTTGHFLVGMAPSTGEENEGHLQGEWEIKKVANSREI